MVLRRPGRVSNPRRLRKLAKLAVNLVRAARPQILNQPFPKGDARLRNHLTNRDVSRVWRTLCRNQPYRIAGLQTKRFELSPEFGKKRNEASRFRFEPHRRPNLSRAVQALLRRARVRDESRRQFREARPDRRRKERFVGRRRTCRQFDSRSCPQTRRFPTADRRRPSFLLLLVKSKSNGRIKPQAALRRKVKRDGIAITPALRRERQNERAGFLLENLRNCVRIKKIYSLYL